MDGWMDRWMDGMTDNPNGLDFFFGPTGHVVQVVLILPLSLFQFHSSLINNLLIVNFR